MRAEPPQETRRQSGAEGSKLLGSQKQKLPSQALTLAPPPREASWVLQDQESPKGLLPEVASQGLERGLPSTGGGPLIRWGWVAAERLMGGQELIGDGIPLMPAK